MIEHLKNFDEDLPVVLNDFRIGMITSLYENNIHVEKVDYTEKDAHYFFKNDDKSESMYVMRIGL